MTMRPPPEPSLRILKFEGGCNFRDLGGYRTRDGRELEWGRVFRTGDQIVRDHGDILKYLRREVGVDDAMRSRVQAALLSA